MTNEKRLIYADEALRMMMNSKSDCPCTDTIRKGVWDVAHDCAISCVDACPSVDTVEVRRLGKLGRLMMPYKGCPRGRMGASGCVDGEIHITELDPIEDIEGDRWIPVLAEELRFLKTRAASAAPVAHGCWETSIDCDTQMHRCSACGARVVKGFYEYENPNLYCYHCGARMDGDGRD